MLFVPEVGCPGLRDFLCGRTFLKGKNEMQKIGIIDNTLTQENSTFSFKEKIEIARQLEKLSVDTIELPEIENERTDILFVRTVSSFVKNSTLSVAAGSTKESINRALAALSATAKPCVRIELPMSTVGMEYISRKKAPKMLEWITECVTAARKSCSEVEFCAVDATRAEKEFLNTAITAAVEAGATRVCICDSTGDMMPDDFAAFAAAIKENISVPMGVRCDNKNGLAAAQAILSVRKGIECIKADIGGSGVPLETFSDMVKNCGNDYGFYSDIKTTELHRTVKQIEWISENAKNDKSAMRVATTEETSIHLDAKDDISAVITAAAKLGYDLSEDDQVKVYEEFCRVADKKDVGAKELEAIIASIALQVPATYKLINYVVNSGNIISSSAQLTLEKDGKEIQGVQMGDGPIDAAFKAIESIIGTHYELDDFQIQSVTEGKQALGSAIVKLRSGGKLYSGNGISTDIIGASIRAYVSAINKIVYEEA